MLIHRSRNRDTRRGAAAVETAACLPLLVILMLGLWEYGRLLHVKQTVANAAREGGRQAASTMKSTAEVQQHIRNYLARAGLNTTGMADPTVVNLTNPSCTDPRQAAQLDRLQVTVSLPTSNFRWVLFTFGSPTLTADCVWPSLADIPVGQPSETIPD